MAQVALAGVTHRYPQTTAPSVVDIDLVVEDGEFLCVLGPSGSGKSTLVRLLAGLEKPVSGEILIGGQNVTALPAGQRDIATITRNHPLYPHMTVAQNIAFPLVNAGIPPSMVQARLRVITADLAIGPLLERYPSQLSRRDRQAAYLARALVRPVGVLLLDEPLAQLDPDDRRHARAQLGMLQRGTATTTIYVTQDQSEAMALADRIAVVSDGRLRQVTTPLDLYHYPATLAVAQFFGTPPMNTLLAVVDGGLARVGELTVPLPHRVGAGRSRVVVGARPEEVHLLPRGAAATVRYCDNAGNDAFVHAWLASSTGRQEIVARCSSRVVPRIGAEVYVDILNDDHVVFFDPATGARLS
jgi:multiple sugar transport system ATP-binding protein